MTIAPADLFGTNDPKELALKSDAFSDALSKSLEVAAIAQTRPELNKSVGLDPASIQQQIAVQRDILKDITVGSTITNGAYSAGSPIGSGLVPFDLEAPAKYLAPRPTPLRNKMPRMKGQGTSHRYKRITGITGSGTGVADIHPGIVETTQNNFALTGSSNALYFHRGSKISYGGDDKIVPYFQFGLSDEVSWAAQYAGAGFQDIRALSAQSLLYSSMLMEEKMMLFGRGTTANGFGGGVSSVAPTITTAARAKAGSEVGLAASTTVFIAVQADAGSFGGGLTSAITTAITVTAGQVVDIQITNPSSNPGTLGYLVYASNTSNSTLTYQGRTGSAGTGTTATTAGFTLGATGAITNTGAAFAAVATDVSAKSAGYDGIMPIVTSSSAGYTKQLNSTFNATSPGLEFQTAFASLYDSVKADPDELLFAGADRKAMSELLKNNNSTNYRLTIQQDETGNAVIGSVITAIQNEVTGKVVPMTVHPWLPQGNVAILSYTLPIPDTQVSNVWTAMNVQDYTGINWPVNQFAYETSSYWYGTFLCYAPAWNGSITGITPA